MKMDQCLELGLLYLFVLDDFKIKISGHIQPFVCILCIIVSFQLNVFKEPNLNKKEAKQLKCYAKLIKNALCLRFRFTYIILE